MKQHFHLLMIFLAAAAFACSNESSRQQDTDTVSRESGEARDTTETGEGQEEEQKYIVFFGNSLTAGYGLDPSQSFPALIQQKVDSAGYEDYEVVNAGVSGETSAGGKSRIGWLLQRQAVDVFVLELGANDGLRGVDPARTKENLKQIIREVRKVNPEAEIILAGMKVPPSMGKEYSERFSQIYPEIAKEMNAKLIPFLLENVAGAKELNQGDGIHPTAEGQKIVARNVWEVLKEVIEEEENAKS